MKTRTHQNIIVRRGFIPAVLLAGIFMVPALRAQPAAQKVDNRFLLIFDTSSDMRQRLPAVQKTLDTLLATSVNGQLRSGDSVGVWTFDQALHKGQFPLQYWKPDDAPTIASNITKFIKKQHYVNKTGFDALPPSLNHVVQGSERLTVLIFCDGKGEIHGTPYDTGINQVFQQRQKERQKERLPIVIGLRSQRGQYVGCMVSFPPETVSLPEFPPLPEIAPAPPVVNEPAPPSPPQPSVPALIIVGTTITNRVPPSQPKPAPANPPPMTTTPPPMTETASPAPAIAKEVSPPDVVPLAPTSAVPAQTNIPTALPMLTKAATPSPESSGISLKGALAIGGAFLAGGLLVFMLRRAR
jgi:hypothetical protein